jgi:putative Mn2+ efflux pump MntP
MEHGIGIWLGVLGMAFALAMDAFAVSIATGIKLSPPRLWQTVRIAACFGFFQFFMPILGWLAGRELAQSIESWDHWVAFGLLLGVGLKMIFDALSSGNVKQKQPDEDQSPDTAAGDPCERKKTTRTDPTRGLVLLMLGLATSIDAFAVGVSMAMLQRSIWIPCVIFGLVAAAMSVIGMSYGGRIGSRIGSEAEIAGGIALILIGIFTIASHFM